MSYLDEIEPGKDINYTILGKRNIISQKENMSKQLTYLSINNGQPKFDLRVWKEQDGKIQVCRGITFTLQELQTLKDILNQKEILIDLFADADIEK